MLLFLSSFSKNPLIVTSKVGVLSVVCSHVAWLGCKGDWGESSAASLPVSLMKVNIAISYVNVLWRDTLYLEIWGAEACMTGLSFLWIGCKTVYSETRGMPGDFLQYVLQYL